MKEFKKHHRIKYNSISSGEFKACSNKARFKKRADARKYAQKLGMFVYKCKYCKDYHLTKTEPRKKSIKQIIQPLIDILEEL